MPRPELPTLLPGDLVACSLPAASDRWVPLLTAAWEAGASVLPVDGRFARWAQLQLIERAGATLELAAGHCTRFREPDRGDGELLAVVATSGSSGEPRLVELTRAAIGAAVSASAEVLDSTAADRWLLCLPPAHIGGMLVVWRHVVLGAPIVLRAFSIDAVRRVTGARFTSLVPAQLRRLLDAGVDLSGFRMVLIGGSPLPPDLADEAAARHVNVVTTYGLTESCGGVVYNGCALPGTDVRIGDAGEVQISGPTLMRGYRSDPAATAATFTDDGWLRTRDAGVIRDGVLSVLGRLDDAILTGGETVWPLEVEAVLSAHPQVAEVAVTGHADREWGQRVVAFVVPHDMAAKPTLEALRAFVGERLPRYKAPRELVILRALPGGLRGDLTTKVRRYELGED